MVRCTVEPLKSKKHSLTSSHFDKPNLSRKDGDKKERPEKKKKAPRAQAAKVSITEDEGWTTVSGTDKVAKVKCK